VSLPLRDREGESIGSYSVSMVEFKKVIVPHEIKALCDFDRRAFHRHPQDLFDPEDWELFESYWVIADGHVVGCTVLLHDVDYTEEPRPGCLYIVSTGVLPEFQQKGFGTQQKAWQIQYAKNHNFTTIVTNMRASNQEIVRVNEKFGFTVRGTDPDYYVDGEPCVVMELDLRRAQDLQ
jgi:RimJ/RimL family protein N-acetyltransferase